MRLRCFSPSKLCQGVSCVNEITKRIQARRSIPEAAVYHIKPGDTMLKPRIPSQLFKNGSGVTSISQILPRYASTQPAAATSTSTQSSGTSTQSQRATGSVYATQSGLFKLALPLKPLSPSAVHGHERLDSGSGTAAKEDDENATLFLLHPRQPLSFIGSLIQTEVAAHQDKPPKQISFHRSDSGGRDGAGHSNASHWVSRSILCIRHSLKNCRRRRVLNSVGSYKKLPLAILSK